MAVTNDSTMLRDGTQDVVQVRVRPLREEDGADGLKLVSSYTHPGVASPAEHGDGGADTGIVHAQPRGSCNTRENLSQTKAAPERADDELRALNEKLMSANEELQCLRAELEAVKLKLRSASAELRSEKCAVESAKNDISNLSSSPEMGTILLDARLRVKLFTRAASKLIKLSDCDVGRPLADLSCIIGDAQLPEDCTAVCARSRAAINAKSEPRQAEYPCQRADGGYAHALERVAVTRDDQGEVARMPGSMLDVADLKPMQKELRTVLDAATDAIITINNKARILSFNLAAESIFRRATKDVMGQSIVWLFGAVSGRLLTQYLMHEKCAEPPTEQRIRKREGQPMDGLRGDGEVFPVEVSVRPVEGCDLFVIVARDLSERRRLEREIIEMSTRQQLEIGREIHDGLGQELTALLMLVSRIDSKLSRCDGAPVAADFGKMTQYVRRAFDTVRRLSKGLAAADIAPEGLLAALQDLGDRMVSASGVECSFRSAGNVNIDDQSRIAHLYRIAQEALSNAVRYAEASRIEIRLEGTPQGLLLSVRDNGKGIQPTAERGGGLGLRLMRYRAGILGGMCNIESQPGGGTLVRCEVPLHGEVVKR